jgi:hypothetical protein
MPTRSTKSRPIPPPPPAPTAPVLRYVENDPAAEDETSEPAADMPAPGIQALRVVKLAPNASFVLCALDGVSVPVKVRRGMGGRLLKKTIQVERLDDGTLTHRP